MNLEDFNVQKIGNNLSKNKSLSNFANSLINELKEYLENGKSQNLVNISKYSEYWKAQRFIEDNVASKIGLSRLNANITYNTELRKAINDSILKISEKEGTLYRKKYSVNGSSKGQVYKIDKFENGKITHITIPEKVIPESLKNEDIIFQYTNDGKINIRSDLKDKILDLATNKVLNLKKEEVKRNNNFKKEGHIYNVFEDDGYIFLNDITEKNGSSIEDIDFIVNNYQGEGKYQVINGEYKKI